MSGDALSVSACSGDTFGVTSGEGFAVGSGAASTWSSVGFGGGGSCAGASRSVTMLRVGSSSSRFPRRPDRKLPSCVSHSCHSPGDFVLFRSRYAAENLAGEAW